MHSSFFEFGVATSGLTAARAAMDVTGHNITNAATVGYSRQYVEQRANKAFSYGNGRGMVPTGVDVYGVGQIRNLYLDKKYWTGMPTLGSNEVKATHAKVIESIFNEPSDSGLNKIINNFFDRMQSLVTNAGDLTYRNNFLQEAQTLVKHFSSTSEALYKQQKELNLELKTTVEQINSYGRQIQTLNKQIYVSELDGSAANDLRDERAVIIDKLSKLVNIDVEEMEMNDDFAAGKFYEPEDRGRSQKQLFIKINGYDFVSHFSMSELSTVERTFKNNPEDATGLYDIYFSSTGIKFELTSKTLDGTLKGIIDVRDGNNKDSMQAKVESVSALPDGRVSVTLQNFTRADMQGEGNIVLNGKTYAYTDFVYDELTQKVTLEIPPKTGTLTVFSDKVHYENARVSGNDLLIEVSAEELKLYNVAINDSSTIKIGDMTLKGSRTNPNDSLITTLDGDFDPNKYNGPDTVTICIKNGASGASLTPATMSELKDAEATIANFTAYKGIPYYIHRMDEFARTVARVLNDGEDRNGNAMEDVIGFRQGVDLYGETGTDFFYVERNSAGKGQYHKLTAANFVVNGELMSDPRKLGCASKDVLGKPDTSDYSTIASLAAVRHNSQLFREGEIDNYLESIIAEIGVDSKTAKDFEVNYVDITTSINNQRLSVSGVDLNEEMGNMVKYQQIFSACAKLINVVNGIYDKMINTMGV